MILLGESGKSGKARDAGAGGGGGSGGNLSLQLGSCGGHGWRNRGGGDREGPSPSGPMNSISWLGPGGTQYIMQMGPFYERGRRPSEFLLNMIIFSS